METKTEQELHDEDPRYFLVKNDTKLKELIVNYVGEQLHPLKPEVSVEDIVNIFADEFPEFLMVVAQENFLRGYTTGLEDAKK